MAKGQRRGNREFRKPKKVKQPEAAPAALKGTPAAVAPAKKKR